MVISIRSVGTAVPRTVLAQDEVRDLFARQPGRSRLARRLITAAFDSSDIDTRHTVVDELGESRIDRSALFYEHAADTLRDPTTGERNALYVDRSPELFLDAARKALDATDLTRDDVTHVVSASCTGFFAPGPDYVLVRELGLRPSTQRLHLGFMGCYAAFPALRAAQAICSADPGAVVLVVCVELCTIHLCASDDPDAIVASSVFADGAAAAVVTARPAPGGTTVLDLVRFESALTPTGEQDMAWTIGDHGFDMVLSRYVPAIIAENIREALTPLLGTSARVPRPGDAIPQWAVHPGGRSILDKVEEALGLSAEQMAPSREVLRRFGNMSSATVLFILADLLSAHEEDEPRTVCAMAFGPGLTVESALLTLRREPAAVAGY